jgi:hypothetical protein
VWDTLTEQSDTAMSNVGAVATLTVPPSAAGVWTGNVFLTSSTTSWSTQAVRLFVGATMCDLVRLTPYASTNPTPYVIAARYCAAGQTFKVNVANDTAVSTTPARSSCTASGR